MNKSEFVLWFIFCLMAITTVFFNQNQAIISIKHYFSDTLKPLDIVLNATANRISYWQNILFDIRAVKESNARLVSENLELYSKLAGLVELEEENSLLKETLNLSKQNISSLLVNIIGRDFQNNRSFLIDRGANDGITVGMIAVAKDRIIIGKIADATAGTSKVQTMLDTQSRIAATTSSSKISGLVRGLGSDVIFDLIAKDKKPEIGELIISSGTDGIWPQGFVIGKIKTVNLRDDQIFNTADIELLANPQNFNRIFIILRAQ